MLWTDRPTLCAAWGETLSAITNNGCFEPGSFFNVWVNADAATNAYMAPYAITIDPTAGWCTFTFSGTVDSITTTLTNEDDLPLMPVNMLCVFKPGAYVVNSYQLWASPTCQYNFGEGNDCTIMFNLPSCFTNGTTFNLWVNVRD